MSGNLIEALMSGMTKNPGVLEAMARQIGAQPAQAENALGSILPILLGGLSKNSSNPQGAAALNSALEKDHDGGVLEDVMGFLGKSAQGPGAGILKHVLGGRRANVEQAVGQGAGLQSGQVGQLLEMVAPLLMGALGKQKRQQGLDASGLASLLNQSTQQVQQREPKTMGLVGKLLDRDGDGRINDDLASMGMQLLGGLFKRR